MLHRESLPISLVSIFRIKPKVLTFCLSLVISLPFMTTAGQKWPLRGHQATAPGPGVEVRQGYPMPRLCVAKPVKLLPLKGDVKFPAPSSKLGH